MPITFSFDIEKKSEKDPNDRTRIQVAFLRFGWEHVGGSSWRYPKLGDSIELEDWFNNVIPALAFFRGIVEHSGMVVSKYSLDAHSETGYRHTTEGSVGVKILNASDVPLSKTGLQKKHDEKLSADVLRKFLKGLPDLF